jgi:hypothetical protein
MRWACRTIWLTCLIALTMLPPARAQEDSGFPAGYTPPTFGFVADEFVPPPPLPSANPFALHRFSLQFLGGGYVTTGIGPRGPSFHHTPVAARLGYTVVEPCEKHFFRGSTELLLELLAAPVTRGPGHITVGPSLLLRHNFVTPGWCMVPYAQAGFGVVYNDSYHDMRYRMFGQAQEFLVQVQLGVRFAFTPDLTLDAEIGLQHISNASFAERNGGANVIGGSLGFTYLFR